MIRTFSDWRRKTERWTKAASRQIDEQAVGPLKTVGEDIADRVRANIRSQNIKGPPLAQSTIDKKGHATKLIDEGQYVESLKVDVGRKSERGRKLFLFTEVTTDERVGQLAIYQEFGTSTIPARPHWRPAVRAARRGAAMREFLKGKWFALTFSNTERD